MDEIDVRGSLFLGGGATYAAPVLLRGANIGGQAVFGSDSLDRPEVAFAAPGSAPGSPPEAPVEPQAPARFAAPLDMGDIRVAGSLDLHGIIAESNVSLDRARVDGDLRLTGARFCADLNMGTIRIGESLEAWGIAWPGPLACPQTAATGAAASGGEPSTRWNLYNCDIRGNFFLSGADLVHLGLLNLSGTRIGGQLFLGSVDHMPPNAWGDRSVLMLRNVSVGKIQDLGGLYTTRPAGDRTGGRGGATGSAEEGGMRPVLGTPPRPRRLHLRRLGRPRPRRAQLRRRTPHRSGARRCVADRVARARPQLHPAAVRTARLGDGGARAAREPQRDLVHQPQRRAMHRCRRRDRIRHRSVRAAQERPRRPAGDGPGTADRRRRRPRRCRGRNRDAARAGERCRRADGDVAGQRLRVSAGPGARLVPVADCRRHVPVPLPDRRGTRTLRLVRRRVPPCTRCCRR
jgi:hypothetical protein